MCGGSFTREGWYLTFVLMTSCKKRHGCHETGNKQISLVHHTTAWHDHFSMGYNHLRSINPFLFVMPHFLMYDYALRQAFLWLCSRTQHTLLCSVRASLSLPLHHCILPLCVPGRGLPLRMAKWNQLLFFHSVQDKSASLGPLLRFSKSTTYGMDSSFNKYTQYTTPH